MKHPDEEPVEAYARSNSTRRRAVRLTSEGRDLLTDALLRRWRELGNQGRLTREGRAILLEVSPTTADRILKCHGVDRNTLEHAFRMVSALWSDDMYEWVAAAEPRSIEEVHTDGTKSCEHPTSAATSCFGAPSKTASVLRGLVCFSVIGVAWLFLMLFRTPISRTRLDKPGDRSLEQFTMHHDAGAAAYHSGKFGFAWRETEEAFAIAEKRRDTKSMAGALGLQGQILAAQGKLEEAAAKFRQAIAMNKRVNYDAGNASLWDVLGSCEARRGNLSVAEQCYERSFQLYSAYGDDGGIASAARGLGSVAACKGAFELAQKWLQSAASYYVNDNPAPGLFLDVQARMAILKSKQGEHNRAVADLKSCHNEWSLRDHPRWQAATKLQLASVYHAAGDHAASRRCLTEAARLYKLVGDQRGMELCSKRPESLTLVDLFFQ